MTGSFGARLAAEFAAGRHMCAGIDPHAPLLAEWGYDDDAAGAERLGREMVAAAAGVAACVKPQIAFFERFGSAGFAALERVLADARAAGVMVIADVKRGDIGSSFAAYADAWLAPGSPLEVDAMTVAVYQGFGTLEGAFGHVIDHGKGLFALAATSNPEARAMQVALRDDSRSVAGSVVADARAFNREHFSDEPVGSVGVVLGATLELADYGIDIDADSEESPAAFEPALPVLAPGFGAQGARLADAHAIFGSLGSAILANESRGILSGGPAGLAGRVRDRAEEIRSALA